MVDTSKQATELLRAYITAAIFHEEKVNGLKHKHGIANVLREVADQLVPEQPHEDTFEYCCDYAQSRERIFIRTKLLAIANKLENND
jgi:hypothetical protein